MQSELLLMGDGWQAGSYRWDFIPAYDVTTRSMMHMRIRPAEPEDALDVARVHVCAWQIGYRQFCRLIISRSFAQKSAPNDTTSPTRDMQCPKTIVAENNGEKRFQ